MKKLLFIVLVISASLVSRAQNNFYSTVSIDFEKTVSIHQLMKANEPEWYENAKDNTPAQTVTTFNFTGDASRSIYKMTKEAVIPEGMWWRTFADDNVVYNDYIAGTTVSQKPVFDQTFLVTDSLLHINWKITNDTRNIAGFECRKAIGTIFDSITVFAFYSDEIMVTGGPEGINGLPGMILGVGIPRIHTTWFATKVNVNTVNLAQVKPATKGKKMTRNEMMVPLGKVLNEWGKFGKNLLMNFVI